MQLQRERVISCCLVNFAELLTRYVEEGFANL